MLSDSGIVAESGAFREILNQAQKVARSSANVLITGESGVGKEIVAQYIHHHSPRRERDFVALNCSAIPETLLEAELFGFAKGAFTGANSSRMGMFEAADQGSLFLDEIGDMDLNLQAKILRVLQERNLKRVGENRYRRLDIRIIAATHRDIAQAVREKKFREDLFFRLNVVTLRVPPLRERREDIYPLAKLFLYKFMQRHHLSERRFAPETQSFLEKQMWKGNVRELENAVERALVLANGPEVRPEDFDLNEMESPTVPSKLNDLFDLIIQQSGRVPTLHELSEAYIQFVLYKNSGFREKAARDLGIDRKTLYRRLTH